MAKKRKLEATGAGRAELRPLLEAAKAEASDVGPRLALADWLEENGDEAALARAEAIRLQMEREAGGPPWALAVERLRERHVREWVGPLAPLFARRLPACERGLLAADVSERTWILNDRAAFASSDEWAWVETARFLSVAPGRIPTVLDSGLFRTVSRLDLGGHPLDRRCLTALASPGLARLRSLRLGVSSHDRDAVAAFVRSPHLAGLAALDLSGYGTMPDAWAALAASDSLAGLRRLAVHGWLGAREGRALVRSPAIRGLHDLSLSFYAAAGPGVAAELAASPDLAGLRRLSLRGVEGVAALAPVRPPHLRRLSLTNTALDPETFATLTAGPLLGGLDDLRLGNNPLGSRGIDALASSGLEAPRALWLPGCGLNDDALIRLAAWPGLARVRVLGLSNNPIGLAGITALAGSPHAASLVALDLSDNDVLSADALRAFLPSPLASRLRWLSMRDLGSPLTVAKSLLARPLSDLRELDLGRAAVGRIGKDLPRLRAAMPACAIG